MKDPDAEARARFQAGRRKDFRLDEVSSMTTELRAAAAADEPCRAPRTIAAVYMRHAKFTDDHPAELAEALAAELAVARADAKRLRDEANFADEWVIELAEALERQEAAAAEREDRR